MKIKFNQACEFEVVESYDEDTDQPITKDETFRPGEEVEVDVCDDKGETVDVQFGDGSMLYGLRKSLYTVVEGES